MRYGHILYVEKTQPKNEIKNHKGNGRYGTYYKRSIYFNVIAAALSVLLQQHRKSSRVVKSAAFQLKSFENRISRFTLPNHTIPTSHFNTIVDWMYGTVRCLFTNRQKSGFKNIKKASLCDAFCAWFLSDAIIMRGENWAKRGWKIETSRKAHLEYLLNVVHT